MANLDQTFAGDLLEASLGGTLTAIASPTVALTTDIPTSTVNGTEVSNTGGSTYEQQPITVGSASSATPSVIANSGVISFTGMPACTVKALEIWDDTRRLWFGELNEQKTVGAGDVVSFASSAISISLG